MTWKKRCVSLIVCFALIVSITVVRPPKADAIAFEAGIAVPIILAVAIASGISFLSSGMTETGLTQYIAQQLQQYATDIGTTVSDWWDGLGTLGRNDSGQVILAPPTYRGIQQFLQWWKTRNAIEVGTVSRQLIADIGFPAVMAEDYRAADALNEQGLSNCFIHSSVVPTESFSYGMYLYNGQAYCVNANGVTRSTNSYKEFTAWCIHPQANGVYNIRVMYGTTKDNLYSNANLNKIFANSSTLSVSQTASYSALDLQDNESVALDLGATVEAGATLEDILAEYLAKIVDNTATAAQEVTTDSGEGEGEGDDDDTAPYLPFIPRIWEKLQGLPDDIADKVHDLFVPSAAFVEALPAEFADVFDSRCGLLTYPAALLADFLTRLATLTAQEPVLRWGNINEPFSDRQLVAAGSYNLNSAIQTEAMQTVYNVYMICVKAAVAFWFVELCKRKYEKIIRS